jgi:drug/metabolite transporter (DMT)-like permease
MHNPRPLGVAVAAFAVGGVGNTLFAVHSGSQAGLALMRFGFGLIFTVAWLLVRRPPRPALRTVRFPRTALALTGLLEAGAVVLSMFAARHTGILVLTVIGATIPVLVGVLAYLLRLPGVSASNATLGLAAVAAAAGSVLLAHHDAGKATSLGIALAAAAALTGALAVIAGVYAASNRSPALVVANVCAGGIVLVGALALSGMVTVVIVPSTVVVALFIAAVAGGVAKAALYWAAARTSPALVSACGAMGVVTAGLSSWLLLGQQPTASQAVLALIAAGCVAVLASLPSRRTA